MTSDTEPNYPSPDGVNEPLTWIYFIRCTETKRIKIGVANHPIRRFHEHQLSSPTILEFVGLQRGYRNLERALHKQFIRQRVRAKGEWFYEHTELLRYIRENATVDDDVYWHMIHMGFRSPPPRLIAAGK